MLEVFAPATAGISLDRSMTSSPAESIAPVDSDSDDYTEGTNTSHLKSLRNDLTSP